MLFFINGFKNDTARERKLADAIQFLLEAGKEMHSLPTIQLYLILESSDLKSFLMGPTFLQSSLGAVACF